jgi:hypothetical protein
MASRIPAVETANGARPACTRFCSGRRTEACASSARPGGSTRAARARRSASPNTSGSRRKCRSTDCGRGAMAGGTRPPRAVAGRASSTRERASGRQAGSRARIASPVERDAGLRPMRKQARGRDAGEAPHGVLRLLRASHGQVAVSREARYPSGRHPQLARLEPDEPRLDARAPRGVPRGSGQACGSGTGRSRPEGRRLERASSRGSIETAPRVTRDCPDRSLDYRLRGHCTSAFRRGYPGGPARRSGTEIAR